MESQEISIRLIHASDVDVLNRVDEDVFDHEINPSFAAEFLSDPRHHLAVAVVDGLVVGMASAVHYVHPDKPPELWINEVGVAESYRRLGLGRRLMTALFERGRELGCRAAWVATEPDNIAARGLYEAVGGQGEESIVYTFQITDDDDPKESVRGLET